MNKYYVKIEEDENGIHEVHREGCSHMPDHWNVQYLGVFDNSLDAVCAAKEIYTNSGSCSYCLRRCYIVESSIPVDFYINNE